MTQEKKHSELPWGLIYKGSFNGPEGEPVSISNGTYGIVPHKNCGWNASPKDLKFIVRACNNFYPLLEACKLSLENSVYEHICKDMSYCEEDRLDCDLCKIEQAIKAAEAK